MKYIDSTGCDTIHVTYNIDEPDKLKTQVVLEEEGIDIIVVDIPLPEITIEAEAPKIKQFGTVAVGDTTGWDAQAGVNVGVEVGSILILRGPDAGKIISLEEEELVMVVLEFRPRQG